MSPFPLPHGLLHHSIVNWTSFQLFKPKPFQSSFTLLFNFMSYIQSICKLYLQNIFKIQSLIFLPFSSRLSSFHLSINLPRRSYCQILTGRYPKLTTEALHHSQNESQSCCFNLGPTVSLAPSKRPF